METRGKQINLVSLGLVNQRSSHVHRSSSASSANNASSSENHPAKRVKRSHTLSGAAPTPPSNTSHKSPRRSTGAPNAKDRRRSQPLAQATPPPSPDDFPHGKIDKSSIDDDIVLGVIDQIESCGNRPHMIKELAAILANSLNSVKSSANPVAIITSRLTNFLRRPWTESQPCPLAKEQVNVQPRRVYYYLTTCPRQPIPLTAENPVLDSMRIISPSISSGPDDQERREQVLEVFEGDKEESRRDREALSPSPELDLGAPDFYTSHHSHSMSAMSFSEPAQSHDLYGSSYQQAASPPLEHEEREFEQTVNDMAFRRASEQVATPGSNPDPPTTEPVRQRDADNFLAMGNEVANDQTMAGQDEETEEMHHQRNHEAASALFGGEYGRLSLNTSIDLALTSSPMMRPSIGSKHMPPPVNKTCFGSADDDAAWHELKSPDCVELSEIDDLLGGN